MRKRDKVFVALYAVWVLGLHMVFVYAAGGWPFVVVVLFVVALCAGLDALHNRNDGRVKHGGDKP